jgi:hypothetical protein
MLVEYGFDGHEGDNAGYPRKALKIHGLSTKHSMEDEGTGGLFEWLTLPLLYMAAWSSSYQNTSVIRIRSHNSNAEP